MRYAKLVRDRIPEIIQAKGQVPTVRVLDKQEFKEQLLKKLQEEVAEYLKSEEVEELADIMEVIYVLAKLHGLDPEKLEEIRVEKVISRGSFAKRLFLLEVNDSL